MWNGKLTKTSVLITRKLITDKSVVQASETRKQLDRLEVECQRLRAHLAQSVPEQEFLREKDQYLAIINRLVDENMHLRQVIGQFEHRRRGKSFPLADMSWEHPVNNVIIVSWLPAYG
jgi:hypothetical protein